MIYTSHRIDQSWREKHPEHKPFKWGYFQALFFFPFGPLATIGYFISAPFIGYSIPASSAIYYLLLSVIGGYAGYMLIVKKRRWAWMFVVIAQFNMINWIINFYYGSNRWIEFTKPRSNKAELTTPDAARPPS